MSVNIDEIIAEMEPPPPERPPERPHESDAGAEETILYTQRRTLARLERRAARLHAD
jgi:hypothetical protein